MVDFTHFLQDCFTSIGKSLQWRHNERDGVSNPQPRDCLLNRLFRRRSKKTSKLHVTGLCAGNSPATGEFPAQMASNAENVSIWWRHHAWRCPSVIEVILKDMAWITQQKVSLKNQMFDHILNYLMIDCSHLDIHTSTGQLQNIC